MTQRTTANKTVRADTQDDDYDSISLNSTKASEGNEDALYNVENILAERNSAKGNMEYLIEWEGYALERATWEPEENIVEERTLRDWSDEKVRITRGYSKPFDVDTWVQRVQEFQEARDDRKKRRREKRKRVGNPVTPSEDEDAGQTNLNYDDDSSDIAEVVFDELEHSLGNRAVHNRTERRSKVPLTSFVVDDGDGEESEVERILITRLPRQRRTSAAEADVANLSEDSLIEDINAKRNRKKAQGKNERVEIKSKRKPRRQAKPPEPPQSTIPCRQPPQCRDTSPSPHRPGLTEPTAKTRAEAPSKTGYQGTANRLPVVRPATQSTRGGTALRGRGGGAIRGSEIKPSFTSTAPQKQKRSLVDSILGEKKHGPHFRTMSAMRKAELAGRAVADQALDPGTLKLVNPSKHRTYTKIPKKSQLQFARKETESATSPDKPNVSYYDDDAMLLVEEPEDLENAGTRQTRQDKQTTFLNDAKPGLDDIGVNNDSSEASKQSIPILQPNSISKPIAKISFDDYKRRNMSGFGDSVTAITIFGNDMSQCASIVFTGINQNSQEPWVQELLSLDQIKFNMTCLSTDLEAQWAFLLRRMLASGNVATDSVGMPLLQNVADTLCPMLCFVFAHKSLVILLVPTKCEEWKFLEVTFSGVLPPPGGDVDLRYFIFEPLLDVNGPSYETIAGSSRLSSFDLKRDHLESVVDLFQELDYKALQPRQIEKRAVNYIFLLFLPEHNVTAGFFQKWLHACNPDYKIFSSQSSGSWRLFIEQSKETGIVLVHESLVPKIFKIPWVCKLLSGKAMHTFWSVSDESFPTSLPGSVSAGENIFPVGTTLSRLFPHGGAIFLTPSFLETEPETTHELLKFIDRKAAASRPWKIVACHKFRQYLLELAIRAADARKKLYASFPEDKTDGDDVAAVAGLTHKECERRFSNYLLVDSILTKERMAGYPFFWDEDVPDEVECPIIYADERIGQKDEKRLVDWFAGWTMSRLDLFRSFLVLGSKSSTPTTNGRAEDRWPVIKSPIDKTLGVFSFMAQQQASNEAPTMGMYPSLKTASVASSTSQSKKMQASTSKKVSWPDGLADDPDNLHNLRHLPKPPSKKVSWPANPSDNQIKLDGSGISRQAPSSISSMASGVKDILGSFADSSSEPPLLEIVEMRPQNATSSLWIGNIGRFTSEKKLREIFSLYGTITSVRVLPKQHLDGFQGFVNFDHINSAINARAMLDDKEIVPGTGPARINFAKPFYLDCPELEPSTVIDVTSQQIQEPLVSTSDELMAIAAPTPQQSSEPSLLIPRGSVPRNATSSIQILDVPPSATLGILREIFGDYGPILEPRIVKKKLGGLQGFVNFEHVNSAINAKASLDGCVIFPEAGTTQINFATPRYLAKSAPAPMSASYPLQPPRRPALLFPNEPRPHDATSSLYLGEIPGSYGEPDLQEIFKPFGHILGIRTIPRKETGGRRSNAFVNFKYTNSAINARAVLSQKEIFLGEGAAKIGFAKTFGYTSPPASPRDHGSSTSDISTWESNSAAAEHTSSTPHPTISRSPPGWYQKKLAVMTESDGLVSKMGNDGDGKVEMGPGDNGDHSCNLQLPRTSHGIDRDANKKALHFVALSGADMLTAERYLEDHHKDVNAALEAYKASSTGEPLSDIQHVPHDGSRFIDRLAFEDEQRAMRLYHSNISSDNRGKPSNLHGSDDRLGNNSDRPQSATGKAFNADITRKFLLSSTRPLTPTRSEISKLSGSTASKDNEIFSDWPVIRGAPQSETEDKVNRTNDPNMNDPAPTTPESRDLRRRFNVFEFEEPTLDWYEKVRRSGRGWEHIWVVDGDNAKKLLGIKST